MKNRGLVLFLILGGLAIAYVVNDLQKNRIVQTGTLKDVPVGYDAASGEKFQIVHAGITYSPGPESDAPMMNKIFREAAEDVALMKEKKVPKNFVTFGRSNKMLFVLRVSGDTFRKNKSHFLNIRKIEFDYTVPPVQKIVRPKKVAPKEGEKKY